MRKPVQLMLIYGNDPGAGASYFNNLGMILEMLIQLLLQLMENILKLRKLGILVRLVLMVKSVSN